MQKLGQLPLGVAEAVRILLTGAMENGQQHGVSDFAQTCRSQFRLHRGAVGLIELPGEQLHLTGRYH